MSEEANEGYAKEAMKKVKDSYGYRQPNAEDAIEFLEMLIDHIQEEVAGLKT